jgi:hypothetical protein
MVSAGILVWYRIVVGKRWWTFFTADSKLWISINIHNSQEKEWLLMELVTIYVYNLYKIIYVYIIYTYIFRLAAIAGQQINKFAIHRPFLRWRVSVLGRYELPRIIVLTDMVGLIHTLLATRRTTPFTNWWLVSLLRLVG